MKLTINKYGSITDESTGKTLLLNGVAIPCGNADPKAALNTKEMVKRCNQHDKLVELNKELVEALEAALSDISIYAIDLKFPADTKAQNLGNKALTKAKELQND